jgi:hypothetical protein
MDLNPVIAMLTVLGLPVGYYIATLTKAEVRHGAKWLEITGKVLVAAVFYTLLATVTTQWVALLWALVLLLALLPTKVHKLCVLCAIIMFFNGFVMGMLASSAAFVVAASLVFVYCVVRGSLIIHQGGWQRMLLEGGALILGVCGSLLGLL